MRKHPMELRISRARLWKNDIEWFWARKVEMAWIQDLHCVMSYYDDMIWRYAWILVLSQLRIFESAAPCSFKGLWWCAKRFQDMPTALWKHRRGCWMFLKWGLSTKGWTFCIPQNGNFNQYCYDKFINQWILGETHGVPYIFYVQANPTCFLGYQ